MLDGVSLGEFEGQVVAPARAGTAPARPRPWKYSVQGYRSRDGGTVTVLSQDPATGGRALRAPGRADASGRWRDRRARPRETLVQYGRFHTDPRDPDELLRLVGLEELARTAFRRLSGGERQRLGLAMALVVGRRSSSSTNRPPG